MRAAVRRLSGPILDLEKHAGELQLSQKHDHYITCLQGLKLNRSIFYRDLKFFFLLFNSYIKKCYSYQLMHQFIYFHYNT